MKNIASQLLILLSIFYVYTPLASSAHEMPAKCEHSGAVVRAIKERVVVGINWYSSGKLLFSALENLGFSIVHISTKDDLPAAVHANIANPKIIKSLVIKDEASFDSDAMAKQLLADFDVLAVMPGHESSVLMVDKLTTSLQNLGVKFRYQPNGYNEAKRDKLELSEVLQKAGLPVPKFIKGLSLDQLLGWAKVIVENGGQIVQKPPRSCSAENIIFCSNEQEAQQAFKRIFGQKNRFNQINTAVVGQEEIVGREFVVNTTSRDRKHLVTDVWEYEKASILITDQEGKVSSRKVYSVDWLISSIERTIEVALVDYAKAVLNTLGIRTGWGHMEIIVRHEPSPHDSEYRPVPYLIDFGNRMMGTSLPEVVQRHTHVSQLNTGLSAFLDTGLDSLSTDLSANPLGGLFDQRLNDWSPFQKHAPLAAVSLITPRADVKFVDDIEERLRSLPYFKEVRFMVSKEEVLRRTIDLETSPALIILSGESKFELRKQIALIREWEASGLIYKDIK